MPWLGGFILRLSSTTIWRVHHGCLLSSKCCSYVASSEQLGWVTSILSYMLSLILVSYPKSFLYFYVTRLKGLIKWLSLVGRSNSCLFNGYSQSFKRFKDRFFKVVMTEVGKSCFYDNVSKLKFLFYWMAEPYRYKEVTKSSLSAKSRWVVEVGSGSIGATS